MTTNDDCECDNEWICPWCGSVNTDGEEIAPNGIAQCADCGNNFKLE